MIKVYYAGDGITYHPKLGKLVGGKMFDIEEQLAKQHIKSGLLKKAAEKKKKKEINTNG